MVNGVLCPGVGGKWTLFRRDQRYNTLDSVCSDSAILSLHPLVLILG